MNRDIFPKPDREHPFLGITLEDIKDKVREINPDTYDLIITRDFEDRVGTYLSQLPEYFSLESKGLAALRERYSVDIPLETLIGAYYTVTMHIDEVSVLSVSVFVEIDEDNASRFGQVNTFCIAISVPIIIHGIVQRFDILIGDQSFDLSCTFVRMNREE